MSCLTANQAMKMRLRNSEDASLGNPKYPKNYFHVIRPLASFTFIGELLGECWRKGFPVVEL